MGEILHSTVTTLLTRKWRRIRSAGDQADDEGGRVCAVSVKSTASCVCRPEMNQRRRHVPSVRRGNQPTRK